ncbi:MAG: LuxR C-terminal-related transcriptional regulator [Trueperaceae bacterium]
MAGRRGDVATAPALVVDDHPLFRLGFVAAWRLARPREPIVEASDLEGARRLLTPRTRLLVVDLLLPDGFGLELAATAARLGVPFVVLSTADAPAIVEAVRRSGAAAFFSKETDPHHILLEIDRILQDPSERSFPATSPLPALTPREHDVLAGLLAGLANREIAELLGLGAETVKSHTAMLFVRLGASDRFEAVRIARDLGYDLALPYLRGGRAGG